MRVPAQESSWYYVLPHWPYESGCELIWIDVNRTAMPIRSATSRALIRAGSADAF